jgi:hypothetical protein
VVHLQPGTLAIAHGQGTWLKLFPRRGVGHVFGGEEYGAIAETGLHAGAIGARTQEVLPSFEASVP